ncbi:MAG: carboxylesterase family protein [Prolixibacteraceae bacterium]|nr:carboxylesterase family protein [Prolixibacteraceae bacterium]
MKIIHFKYLYCILILLFTVTHNITAQQFRYSSQLFNKVDTLKEIEYAQTEWLNNPIALLSAYNIHYGESTTEKRPLLMDIFMPHGDTVSKRPAIVFLHGGALLIGSRLNDDMVAMCDSFARKGYVTATIDYRLGMGATFSGLFSIKVDEINGYRAAYRGIQDTRAAIRFLKHNADSYGIDTSKIFITGSSAGSILALQNIYIDRHEINEFAFTSPSLGDIDAVGVQGYESKAAAIASLWGAIESPQIIENNSTPVFLVHGTEDDIVPYKKGVPLAALIPEEYSSFIQLNLPETFGSFCIDTALNNRNINHETYFVEGEKHEFYGVATGEFPSEGPNAYWDTIQTKITDFFFEQFKPNAEIEYDMNNLEFTFYNESADAEYSFWDFGDGTSSTDKTTIHNYAASGNYLVNLTTCNQNMACDTLSVNITAGIIDNLVQTKSSEISVYPNPVYQQLNIKGIDEPYNLTIYDLTGRIRIIKHDITNSTINLGKLQNGIYYVNLSNKNLSVTRKIVKID